MSSLNPGLVLDLPLNNIIDSNKLNDAYGNARGTLYGNPNLIPDDTFGSCLNFDGVDDYVSIDGGLNIIGNSPRSIFCWVKYTNLNDNNLYAFVSTGTATNSQAFNLVNYSNTVGVMGYVYDHYPSSGANINDGKWHYIGCTYDGTTLKTYVDASLVSQIARGSYNTTGNNNYIGKSNHVGYERYFKGQISQVRIFNGALSPQEIERDIQSDLKGLVIYLNFNYSGTDNKIIDASGNGNKSTLYGNAKPVPDKKFGKCLTLDGKDDYLDTGALFPNITDTFTIEGWVWPESEHQIDIQSNNSTVGTGGQKYLIWPTHGTQAYGSGHAGAGISVGTNGISVYEHAANYMPAVLVWQGIISKTQWTHIAIVYKKKQPSLYINGEFIKEGSTSNQIVHPSAGDAGKAGFGGGIYGYFQGKIANIRIYNRALSTEEIRRDIQDDLVGLALYFTFDSVTSSKKVIDDSVNANHGVINGNVEIVSDKTETFAKCLSCNGTDGYIEIADPFKNRAAFTISLWVKPSVLNDNLYHGIIGKQGDIARKPGLWLSPSNGLHYDSYDLSFTRYDGILNNFFNAAGEWVHIAWVKQGTEYKFYQNGRLFDTKAAPEQFYTVESTSYWIGKVDKFWKGEIAHVRVYSRGLSPLEIQQDMEEDQPSLAAFRNSYPISFSLHDDNGDNCLYITDGAGGQSLHLELSNTSQQNLQLKPSNDSEATSENYHFELRFKPGTLHLASLDQIGVTDKDWKLSYEEQSDGTVSLYLLYTNTSDIKAKTIGPTETKNLTLLNIRAAGDGGARVTQVELKYQNLCYPDQPTVPVSGRRVQRLSVVNHLGKQNIPLHVGFVGGNTILNDGDSPNELTLRITNVLKKGSSNVLRKDSIPLNNSSSDAPSKFIISFDVQSDNEVKDWALAEKSNVGNINIDGGWRFIGTIATDINNATQLPLKPSLALDIPDKALLKIVPQQGSPINVSVNGSFKIVKTGQSQINLAQAINAKSGDKIYAVDQILWKIEPNLQGESPEWILTNQDKKELQAGESIQLRFSNIRSSLPSGHTNLYIRYENIPGYWDGQFVLPIEKAPILYQGNKVGIGVINPTAKFHVVAPGGFPNNVPIVAQSNSTFFGARDSQGNERFAINLDSDGTSYPVTFYDKYAGNWKNSITLKLGNVGIGTKEPRTALDTGTGLMSGAANDYQKAQFTMSGGGTVTWGGLGGRLKWTKRFIAISMERPKSFLEGFIDILQPTSDLPRENVYDGQSRSANADGIVLREWEALYAIHTVGGNQNAVTFRIENYTNNFYAPSNWLLVAVVNGDDGTVKLGTGVTLSKNSSSTKGSPIPCGTIFMWSGTNIPDGWALCNGQKVNDYTTPDLRGRFIVGYSGTGDYDRAGDLSEKGNTIGKMGGADRVALTIDQMPTHQHSGKTDENNYTLELNAGGGLGFDYVYAQASKRGVVGFTHTHSHQFQTQETGKSQPHENRPPYYVLAYIMKV